MRHHHGQRVFSLRPDTATLMRSLARELIVRNSINTTLAKAKELRPFIERLVTHAKKDTIHTLRLTRAFLQNDEVIAKKLVAKSKVFEGRNGGYTRITKTGRRTSDGAEMAQIEFVD